MQGSQRELLNLSQQEYAHRIEELNQSLKEAWASDQKVKALKIVIQVNPSLCVNDGQLNWDKVEMNRS